MADEKKKGTPISLNDEVAGGVYANGMKVWHTKEEFILDFFMIAPVKGRVCSRVIISPGHLKRIINVLQSTLEKFEKEIRKVEIAEEPRALSAASTEQPLPTGEQAGGAGALQSVGGDP